MIKFETSGSWSRTDKFLSALSRGDFYRTLDRAGREGVDALAAATPVESGVTSASWSYEIQRSRGSASISWTNSETVNGVPLVILLQYGHGTGTGGYVQGRDFINPALKPVFDKIANDVWKAVTSA